MWDFSFAHQSFPLNNANLYAGTEVAVVRDPSLFRGGKAGPNTGRINDFYAGEKEEPYKFVHPY